jgi:hypothetical protein
MSVRPLTAATRAIALRDLAARLLIISLMVVTGYSTAWAQNWSDWYKIARPVPDNLKLPRIVQPPQGGTAAMPQSVTCVPTCASIILQDNGLPINPEMAGGHYAPPGSKGTDLWSAARDLKINGGMDSNL